MHCEAGIPLYSPQRAALEHNWHFRNDWWSYDMATTILNQLWNTGTTPFTNIFATKDFSWTTPRTMQTALANTLARYNATGHNHVNTTYAWLTWKGPPAPVLELWQTDYLNNALINMRTGTVYALPYTATNPVIVGDVVWINQNYFRAVGISGCHSLPAATLGGLAPDPISYHHWP